MKNSITENKNTPDRINSKLEKRKKMDQWAGGQSNEYWEGWRGERKNNNKNENGLKEHTTPSM